MSLMHLKCMFGKCKKLALEDDYFCQEHKDMLDGPKEKPSKRNCLTCGKPFRSEGKHNRVCRPCKNTANWEGGNDTQYSTGTRRGRSDD